MSGHASRTSVDTVDGPAHAAGSVFDSAKQGASEIQSRVSEALPATSHFLGRVVYKTSYALSFGVTFPVMMVVRMVPKDNALVHGLIDGAVAARDQVDEWRGEPAEDFHDAEDETVHASDNGSAHHHDSAEHATHRRPKAKRSAARKTTTKADVAEEGLRPSAPGRMIVRIDGLARGNRSIERRSPHRERPERKDPWHAGDEVGVAVPLRRRDRGGGRGEELRQDQGQGGAVAGGGGRRRR